MLTLWLRQPQRLWLRRALFQIHLWIGLAASLYVVVLSLTGSVLVYRIELNDAVSTPRVQVDERLTPMTAGELRAAAARAYPGWRVSAVHEGRYQSRAGGRARRPPDPRASVVLDRGNQTRERLFNPYTGQDLGDNTTQGQFFVLWLVRLHDQLLLEGSDGLWWNGLLSLVFTLLVVTGAVVWWPGVARWQRSLRVRRSGGWPRFVWDLHSALGIWLSLFMLMWGISGWYLGMPAPLSNFVDSISPDPPNGEYLGEMVLTWLAQLHFGRWRAPGWGPWLQAAWAIVGLVPALMAITGGIMWWNRVVRRRRSARTAFPPVRIGVEEDPAAVQEALYLEATRARRPAHARGDVQS